MSFKILHQDSQVIAIEKPAGFHVHPPEDSTHRIPRSQNCLFLLRKQIEQHLYPVHRLDRATSGVLLFALSSDSARELCFQFQQHKIQKTYFCVVRGWTHEQGRIDHPLKSDSAGDQGENPEFLEAITDYETIARIELPIPSGRYSTSRYSLVKVSPRSGRMHQIRRHFAHLSHPLVGDTVYGDGVHNRLFREQLQMSGLLLKAYSIQFYHPQSAQSLRIQCHWNRLWHSVFDLFSVCPVTFQEFKTH